MMTSRYDSQILREPGSRIPLRLLEDNLMWAEVMRSAGYQTAAVLPIAYFRDWRGLTQGFDVVNLDAIPAYVAPVFHNAEQVTDAAIDVADITLVRSDLLGVADAIMLSRATLGKIRQNLFFAFIYNVIGIPLAALGWLNPVLAGAAMAMSSVSVVSNSLLLRRWRAGKQEAN